LIAAPIGQHLRTRNTGRESNGEKRGAGAKKVNI